MACLTFTIQNNKQTYESPLWTQPSWKVKCSVGTCSHDARCTMMSLLGNLRWALQRGADPTSHCHSLIQGFSLVLIFWVDCSAVHCGAHVCNHCVGLCLWTAADLIGRGLFPHWSLLCCPRGDSLRVNWLHLLSALNSSLYFTRYSCAQSPPAWYHHKVCCGVLHPVLDWFGKGQNRVRCLVWPEIPECLSPLLKPWKVHRNFTCSDVVVTSLNTTHSHPCHMSLFGHACFTSFPGMQGTLLASLASTDMLSLPLSSSSWRVPLCPVCLTLMQKVYITLVKFRRKHMWVGWRKRLWLLSAPLGTFLRWKVRCAMSSLQVV